MTRLNGFVLVCVVLSGCASLDSRDRSRFSIEVTSAVDINLESGDASRAWVIAASNAGDSRVSIPTVGSLRVNGKCMPILHELSYDVEARLENGTWVSVVLDWDAHETTSQRIVLLPGESSEFLVFEHKADQASARAVPSYRVVVVDDSGARYETPATGVTSIDFCRLDPLRSHRNETLN